MMKMFKTVAAAFLLFCLPNSASYDDTVFTVITDRGAIGNGDPAHAAANISAINQITATKKCAFIPRTSPGFNFGTGQVVLPPASCVIGENEAAVFSNGANLFYVAGSSVRISGLTLDLNGAPPGATAIRLGTNTGVIWQTKLHDLHCSNCPEFVGDDHNTTTNNNYVVELEAYGLKSLLPRGRQFYLTNSRGFIHFRDVYVDNGGNQPANFECARFENFAGVELERFDVTGRGIGATYNPNVTCLVFQGNPATGLNAAVWFTRVFIDTTIGHAIELSDVLYFHGTFVETSLNLGNSLTLRRVADGLLSNSFFNGAIQLGPIAAAGAVGLVAVDVNKMTFSNIRVTNNTGSAFLLYNTSGTTWTGVQAFGNGLYPWYEMAGSDGNVKVGGNLAGNGVSTIVEPGANSRFLNYTMNGTYIPASK